MRFALALVVIAACGGAGKHAANGAGSGSGPALYAKKMSVGWGLVADNGKTDVFLETTDETGRQTSYPVGSYPGDCRRTKPAPQLKAATGVECMAGDIVELDAVIDGEQVIVVREHYAYGQEPDPMAREEVTRVSAAPGAAIEVPL
jgi:hypothetical protein